MGVPLQKEIKVKLSVYSCSDQTGSLTVVSYDKKERLARAIKFGGLTWLAAIGFIFIPVLHFVLVPTGIVLGPIVFWRFLNQQDVIINGAGTCPKCSTLLSISEQKLDWPLQIMCSNCGALVVAVNLTT
jgi:hypothetical protein